VEYHGEIAIATLNRPERLNALTHQLFLDLTDFFNALNNRHDIRVVILRGNGRAFCAGADLDSEAFVPPGAGRAQKQMAVQRAASGVITAMRSCPQPIIALLKGPVCGGGFSIALAADVRLASPDARMNVANLKVGLGGADMGSGYFLPRLIGLSAASALLLTGDFIDARRAYDLSLIAELASDIDDLDQLGGQWASRMLAASPMGLRLTKRTLNELVDSNSLSAALALEDLQQTVLLETADHREAVAAFKENRNPDYCDE
jgi:enoyl-CoA hydratase/carnithine racemase